MINTKQIKIGFTGTHGTGKTTACHKLIHSLKVMGYDVDYITESARSCPFPINEQSTQKSQLWILSDMLKKEVEAKAPIVICDRTLIDVYAYTYRVNKDIAELLAPFINSYSKTYDIIFYMKPVKEYLVADGTRSVNKLFQKEIKDIIDKYISDWNIPVKYLTTDEERLDVVKESLDEQ